MWYSVDYYLCCYSNVFVRQPLLRLTIDRSFWLYSYLVCKRYVKACLFDLMGHVQRNPVSRISDYFLSSGIYVCKIYSARRSKINNTHDFSNGSMYNGVRMLVIKLRFWAQTSLLVVSKIYYILLKSVILFFWPIYKNLNPYKLFFEIIIVCYF